MKVSQIWSTPDGDAQIAYMARVSNPNAQPEDSPVKLIKYLIDHKHWSPFEMACMCLEIETTRDIGRQILRHRSFHFQEFSQRYAKIEDKMIYREVRLQDRKNRQNSVLNTDKTLQEEFDYQQYHLYNEAHSRYRGMLDLGIAKEVARALLPEGLTPTRMYMQGTIRDWIHYISIRTDLSTQKEHRDVAIECGRLLQTYFPVTYEAAEQVGII